MNRRFAINPHQALDEQTPVEKAIGVLAIFALCVGWFALLGMLMGY